MDIQKYIIQKNLTIKETLSKLDELFAETLFIEQNSKLIAAISMGDIRRELLKNASLSKRINKFMNTDPIYCEKNAYNQQVIKNIFLEKKIASIPIVNKEKKVIDIIFRNSFFEKTKEFFQQIDASVLIMAGGKGTRLDPFTRILPKALLPIGETTCIDIILNEYRKFGIKNFFISTYEKSKIIESYFSDMTYEGNIKIILEPKPLGTAGALEIIKENVKSQLFISNCDVVIKADYNDIFNYHINGNFSLTMVTSLLHYQIPYGVCELDKKGDLEKIIEKPEYDMLVNSGMYLINKNVLKFIPKDKFFQMTDLIKILKTKKHKIGIFPVSEKSCFDVGQWDQYNKNLEKMNLFFSPKS